MSFFCYTKLLSIMLKNEFKLQEKKITRNERIYILYSRYTYYPYHNNQLTIIPFNNTKNEKI